MATPSSLSVSEADAGQHVTLLLRSSEERSGFIYTIDPLSGNVVLYNPENNKASLITRHAIVSCQINHDRPAMAVEALSERLQMPEEQQLYRDAGWRAQRRDALVHLLTKQHVPFRQDDPVIIVLGQARVEPPYVATSVYCENSIIRQRVRELVMSI
ncbi:hypothetical protein BCR43DRAFT_490296 [Syncephalastrum racemosum]|uniref:AD domain-containing protein n=1 Tax=Syncephalastrum racemosum TaxID=13706 RepID=A0A1X2HFP1_SYNRA|nr:hypothetical protein BCR43DRAFT_490296 [Syncephalastrum racemosum]